LPDPGSVTHIFESLVKNFVVKSSVADPYPALVVIDLQDARKKPVITLSSDFYNIF
jgi:hypothetical protein